MNVTGITQNSMVQLVAGMLIGVSAVAGIYLFVDASATSMGSGFRTAETTRHMQVAEFTSAIAKAADEHGAARERCAALNTAKKSLCNIEAGTVEIRARSDARMKYRDSNNAPAIQPVASLKSARNIDVVLYRAHRQWPY